MALKHFKPVTASLRHKVIVDKSGLYKGRPIKGLTISMSKHGGRNNLGRTTSYHRGGGHRKIYRVIDFKRSMVNVPAKVIRIEYDPNRSCFIALLSYPNRILSYIIAPNGLEIGSTVMSGERVDIKPGNSLPLINIPVGTLVHNIEISPGKGGQIARAAGAYAGLVKKDIKTGLVMLRLMSGELRYVSSQCMATVGIVSNLDRVHTQLGKAGASRWIGRRPVVRGVAMNPVDHPHGGGEGKTASKRPSVTPWGRHTKGQKTRRLKYSNKYIVSRRK